MQEIWKDIPQYKGLYQVSNLGNVKSLTHVVKQFNGTKYIDKKYYGKTLKYSISRNGYKKVILYNRSKKKTFLIHRLVAEAFIPNPHNLPCVNHKNEIKTDNNVNNLEWCTQSYNINYGERNNKVSEALKNKPKTIEHIKKLKESALKRIIIRDDKGRIISSKMKGMIKYGI